MLLGSIHEKFTDRQTSLVMLEVRIVVASGGVDYEGARQSLLKLVLELFYSSLLLGDGYICVNIYTHKFIKRYILDLYIPRKEGEEKLTWLTTPPTHTSCCLSQR